MCSTSPSLKMRRRTKPASATSGGSNCAATTVGVVATCYATVLVGVFVIILSGNVPAAAQKFLPTEGAVTFLAATVTVAVPCYFAGGFPLLATTLCCCLRKLGEWLVELWLFRLAALWYVWCHANCGHSTVSLTRWNRFWYIILEAPQPSDWFWFGSDRCVPDLPAVRRALGKELLVEESSAAQAPPSPSLSSGRRCRSPKGQVAVTVAPAPPANTVVSTPEKVSLKLWREKHEEWFAEAAEELSIRLDRYRSIRAFMACGMLLVIMLACGRQVAPAGASAIPDSVSASASASGVTSLRPEIVAIVAFIMLIGGHTHLQCSMRLCNHLYRIRFRDDAK